MESLNILTSLFILILTKLLDPNIRKHSLKRILYMTWHQEELWIK